MNLHCVRRARFRKTIYVPRIAILTLFFLTVACETVNKDTVVNMPTAKLCDLLGPNWITSPSEDIDIYKELEKRGASCFKGYVVSEGKNRKESNEGNYYIPSSGSGTIINEAGTVLTNAHVVSHCATLEVVHNQERHAAKLLTRDEINDLAVLKFNTVTPYYATLRKPVKVRLAEPVVVFGYPLLGLLAEQIHVTSGEITALSGLRDDSRFLQISAPVQPGNSGGPVVDKSGFLIGVATGKLDSVAVAGITGDIPQNVNFALSGSIVVNLLDIHKIRYYSSSKSGRLSKPEIAEKVGPAVVIVLCNANNTQK